MEMIKSRWMVVFVLVAFLFTAINSINTKKYDENNKEIKNSYAYINID